MPTLPLKSASKSWESEYKLLLAENPWLVKKLNRARRMREQHEYLLTHVAALRSDPREPLYAVDLGCGPGELLEILRDSGFRIFGIDAATGEGGMGSAYLRAAELLCERQQIPTFRLGFEAWLKACPELDCFGKIAILNSRGSWEQMHSRFMEGIPHDRHHRADQLAWRIDADLREFLRYEFCQIRQALHPSAVFLLHANGSINHEDYSVELRLAAESAGFQELSVNDRVFKWKVR